MDQSQAKPTVAARLPGRAWAGSRTVRFDSAKPQQVESGRPGQKKLEA
jgi:hypothetical protein